MWIGRKWTKWNISLTTWFRDYVFLPVAYKVSGKIKSEKVAGIKTDYIIYAAGLAVTWSLTGLWHGANYTFLVWGLIHGLLLLIYHVSLKSRKKMLKNLKISKDNRFIISIEVTFTLLMVMLAWVFFRADSTTASINYLNRMCSSSLLSVPDITLATVLFTIFFFVMEWRGRNGEYGLSGFAKRWPRVLRWLFYYVLVFAIFFFMGKDLQFVYFQF